MSNRDDSTLDQCLPGDPKRKAFVILFQHALGRSIHAYRDQLAWTNIDHCAGFRISRKTMDKVDPSNSRQETETPSILSNGKENLGIDIPTRSSRILFSVSNRARRAWRTIKSPGLPLSSHSILRDRHVYRTLRNNNVM